MKCRVSLISLLLKVRTPTEFSEIKAINYYCDTNLCYVMLSRDFSGGLDQGTPVGCGLFGYCYLSKQTKNRM